MEQASKIRQQTQSEKENKIRDHLQSVSVRCTEKNRRITATQELSSSEDSSEEQLRRDELRREQLRREEEVHRRREEKMRKRTENLPHKKKRPASARKESPKVICTARKYRYHTVVGYHH